MEKRMKRKLLSLANKAESLAGEIRGLCQVPECIPEGKQEKKRPTAANTNLDSLLSELRTKSREDALANLEKLSHVQLGEVYRKLGGLSQEAKKPKKVVIDRILWTLFDFQRGHAILRNGKDRPTT